MRTFHPTRFIIDVSWIQQHSRKRSPELTYRTQPHLQATEATTTTNVGASRKLCVTTLATLKQGPWHPRVLSRRMLPPPRPCPRSTAEPPAPLPPTTHRWRRFPVAVGGASYSPLPLVAVPTRHGRHGSHRPAPSRAPLPSARGGWDGRGIGNAPSPAACCDGG